MGGPTIDEPVTEESMTPAQKLQAVETITVGAIVEVSVGNDSIWMTVREFDGETLRGIKDAPQIDFDGGKLLCAGIESVIRAIKPTNDLVNDSGTSGRPSDRRSARNR